MNPLPPVTSTFIFAVSRVDSLSLLLDRVVLEWYCLVKVKATFNVDWSDVCWPEALKQIRISDIAFLAQMGFLFCTDGVNQTPTDGYVAESSSI
jgi:hypothetical protein